MIAPLAEIAVVCVVAVAVVASVTLVGIKVLPMFMLAVLLNVTKFVPDAVVVNVTELGLVATAIN